MHPRFLADPNGPIKIQIEGRGSSVPGGTEVRALLNDGHIGLLDAPLAAVYNQRLVSLSYPLRSGGTLRWIRFGDREGWDVYRRSAALVLYEAMREAFPDFGLVLEQTHGDGLYYSIRGSCDRPFGTDRCARLAEAMRSIVRADLPIQVRRISVDAARAQLRAQGQLDKLALLRTHWETSVRIVVCGETMDLFHSPLADRTGRITQFRIVPYDDGFLLRLPRRGTARVMGRTRVSRVLFAAHQETRQWNSQVGVENLGQLNRLTLNGGLDSLVRVVEGDHERRIAAIAGQIATRKRRPRLVLVAGPSSSGKTTFVKRLSVQLQVLGIHPVSVSLDDFFVDRSRTPRDDSGNLDFEALNALDLRLLNRVLLQLLERGKTRVPRYDFHTGRRAPKEKWPELHLGQDELVLVEGIHGLNPALTARVPSRAKFKIYVSALTQLCIDDHNRIFTSDTRLLRRIVRDRRYRGYSAAETITRWPLVRRGEMRHIFPFQDNADVLYNSALLYEHAVLRNEAERYLLEVPDGHPAFTEAYRLLGFLRLIVPAPADAVPQTSLLREFIGGSAFRY